MKKTTAMLLCSLLTLSLGTLNGCGAKSTDNAASTKDAKSADAVISTENTEDQANANKTTELFNDNAPDIISTDDQTQIPNPFTECDTLEDAEALAGFSISVPASIDGYTQEAITAIPDEMIHVSYENGDEEMYFRKGTLTDDLSGNYNVYAYEDTISLDGLNITVKGDADQQLHVAFWSDEEHSYAIGSSAALDADTMAEYIRTLAELS